jgi:hypothetical protein
MLSVMCGVFPIVEIPTGANFNLFRLKAAALGAPSMPCSRNAIARGFWPGRAIAPTVLVVPKSMPVDSGQAWFSLPLANSRPELFRALTKMAGMNPGHAPFALRYTTAHQGIGC